MLFPIYSVRRRNHAFTLIELLTVIAIIGILAAILIPVAGSVRESARAANCMSNLRQLGTGMQLYANETGVMPAARYEDENGVLLTYWQPTIWEYVGYEAGSRRVGINYERNNSQMENVFHCPTTRDGDLAALLTPGSDRTDGPYSYSLNYLPNYTYFASADAQTTPIPLEALSTPSATVLIYEGTNWRGHGGFYHTSHGLMPHNRSTNFLFFDAHVERLPYGEVPEYDSRNSPAFWGGHDAF